jgi:hypothetical protein
MRLKKARSGQGTPECELAQKVDPYRYRRSRKALIWRDEMEIGGVTIGADDDPIRAPNFQAKSGTCRLFERGQPSVLIHTGYQAVAPPLDLGCGRTVRPSADHGGAKSLPARRLRPPSAILTG